MNISYKWWECLLVVAVCSIFPVCAYVFHLFDFPVTPGRLGNLAQLLAAGIKWGLAPLSAFAGGLWVLLFIASLAPAEEPEKEEKQS